MGNKLARKILAGCFIAVISLITIFGSALLAFVALIEPHLIGLVVTFAVVGLLLFAAGKAREKLRVIPENAAGQAQASHGNVQDDDKEHPLAFFNRLDFWGGALMTSSLPILFFNTSHLHLKHPAPPPPPPPPPIVEVVEPVVFPPMKLQGVVCNGDKSMAVIDGQPVAVGEDIHGVRLIAVDPLGATVELKGATNRLALEENPKHPPSH